MNSITLFRSSRNAKLLASALALIVISFAAVTVSFANFTAAPVTVPTSSFASGTLSLSADNSSAVYTATNAKIGDAVTGSITITNTGSLPAVLALTGSLDAGSSALLAAQLTLKVYVDTDNLVGALVYNGSLGGFTSATPTQTLAPHGQSGDHHAYFFHVGFPSTGSDAGDNVFQGLNVSSTFTWNANQA